MFMPIVSTRAVQFTSSFLIQGSLTNTGVLTGYTILNKILPGAFTKGGNSCKLIFSSPTVPYSLNDVFIFNPATSGNAYNSDGNQVRATFNGGSNGLSVTAPNGSVTSDACAFVVDPSQTIFVGMNVNVAAGLPYIAAPATKFIAYTHASKQEAGTTLKTASYTAQSGRVYCNFSVLVAS